MPCSGKRREYHIPEADFTVVICDGCMITLYAELRQMSPAARVEFIHLVEGEMSGLELYSLEDFPPDVAEEITDALALYVAYEKFFAGGFNGIQ